MKKIFLLSNTILTSCTLPLLVNSCAIKDPENFESEITLSEIEEGSVFFIEQLFNSNYFNQILLSKKHNEVNRQDIITLAKSHPHINNLDSRTVKEINQILETIKINQIDEKTLISLKIKNLEYEHQISPLNNDNAYTFVDNQIKVDIDQLNSFNDIFNVFSDLWNLKSKYNNLVSNPYSQIYDYQFKNSSSNNQNFDYLAKRAKINNEIADVYAWNFQDEIVFFDNKQNTFSFEIEELKTKYDQLTSLTALYSDKNYYVQWRREDEYEIIEQGIDRGWGKRPNFAGYPTIYFGFDNQIVYDQLTRYNEWNPIYTSSCMPQNSYMFYAAIISKIYADFFNFSKSEIFINRISHDFDKNVKIYEYSKATDQVAYHEYSDLDYKNTPVNINHNFFDHRETLSYLEYMLTQWLFNSQEYVENFETFDLSKSEIENLPIEVRELNGSEEVIVDSQIGEKWIIQRQKRLIFEGDKVKDFNKVIDTNILIEPRYGYINSWRDNNSFSNPIGLIISQNNDSYSVESKYVEASLNPQDIVSINDQRLQEKGQALVENNDNKVLDIIDLEWSNQKLANYLKKHPQVYNVEQSRNSFAGPSGNNRANLLIKLDLTNSDFYFTKHDDVFISVLSQKIEINFELKFYISGPDLPNIIWRCRVTEKNIKYLD